MGVRVDESGRDDLAPGIDFLAPSGQAGADGNYPVAYDPLMDKHIIERRRNRMEGLGEVLAKDEMQIKLL